MLAAYSINTLGITYAPEYFNLAAENLTRALLV